MLDGYDNIVFNALIPPPITIDCCCCCCCCYATVPGRRVHKVVLGIVFPHIYVLFECTILPRWSWFKSSLYHHNIYCTWYIISYNNLARAHHPLVLIFYWKIDLHAVNRFVYATIRYEIIVENKTGQEAKWGVPRYTKNKIKAYYKLKMYWTNICLETC